MKFFKKKNKNEQLLTPLPRIEIEHLQYTILPVSVYQHRISFPPPLTLNCDVVPNNSCPVGTIPLSTITFDSPVLDPLYAGINAARFNPSVGIFKIGDRVLYEGRPGTVIGGYSFDAFPVRLDDGMSVMAYDSQVIRKSKVVHKSTWPSYL